VPGHRPVPELEPESVPESVIAVGGAMQQSMLGNPLGEAHA
jgi:hypothetical protein